MKALELYQFITINDVEFHWGDNEGKRDVILFVFLSDFSEFYELFTQFIFEDEGISIVWKGEYMCIWMDDITAHYNIELSEVFGKDTGFH